MVTLFKSFWGKGRQFATAAVLFYISTSRVRCSDFSTCSLTHIIKAILAEMKCYFIVVYISLMSDVVEHLFKSLLVILVSSLEKCLFISFSHFVIIICNLLYAFSLLTCKNSLCITSTSLLSDKWYPSIFSHYLGCLFMFLIMSFEAQKFLILMKSNLSLFSFVAHIFDFISKKPLLNSRSQNFLLCLLLRIL